MAQVTFLAPTLSEEEKSSLAFCSARALGEAPHPRKGSSKGIRRIFILVSLHGKRESEKPSLEFGDPEKRESVTHKVQLSAN